MYRPALLAGITLLAAPAVPVPPEPSGAAVRERAAHVAPGVHQTSAVLDAPGAAPGTAPSGVMVLIPGGGHRPLHADAQDTEIRIAPFQLDRDPVTRGEFLEFVRANPAWQRGRVDSGAADASYLDHWTSSEDPGTPTDLRRPVTAISRTAAEAYCSARGARLPTLDEWEYVAAASATARNAMTDPRFVQELASRYATRRRSAPPVERGAMNAYGVRGLHDLVWEFVADPHDGRHTPTHASDTTHGAYCASAAIGAADPTNYPAFLRYAVRSSLTERSTMETLGFRCAR